MLTEKQWLYTGLLCEVIYYYALLSSLFHQNIEQPQVDRYLGYGKLQRLRKTINYAQGALIYKWSYSK